MQPILSIDNLKHKHLIIKHWQIFLTESWVVVGKNGSGKQYLDQLLTDKLANYTADELLKPNQKKVSLISFEAQQAVYEYELKIDESDITNEVDYGTKAKDFLPADKLNHPLIAQLGLTEKLETGYRQLSTGESRKLLILKAIFSGIDLLICDNPFDSLDTESCQALSETLKQASQQGICVLLLLSNRQDIPLWCQQVAFIERGELLNLGQLNSSKTEQALDQLLSIETLDNNDWPDRPFQISDYQHTYLAQLENCSVSYNQRQIFSEVSLNIKPLEHTLITGKNGSGKSTLMHLITGDCPQCFSNPVTVFGYRRGSGETIWDIKKNIGLVSSELHRSYRVNCNVLTVVLSGFYDSIGLYKQPDATQLNIAKHWLNKIGMRKAANSLFSQLSYGEQRLVLITRALVKAPLLLMLDEPTQGLDEVNRHKILNFLQHIESQRHSTIVLVSHREDEHLPLFKQKISLS